MKTILIVDDDPDFAEAIRLFLQANGFRVLEARDGAEGLRLARIARPDLVIMDIVMRERTEGFFTVQEMRRTPELKDVPIFVLSSLYSQYPEFRIAPDSGWLAHDEFFSKPVDLPAMLGKIRQHLGMTEVAG
jgi:two-component system alkaline phosphatase synthesis response regulator PhoP